MGFLGFDEKESSKSSVGSNEDIVREVASEAASSVQEMETNPEEKQLINTFREVKDPISRRDFLRLAGIFAVGLGAVACTPKQSFRDEKLESTVDAMRPESTKTPEIEKSILVNNPIRLNTNDFSIGAEGYPSAIVDRSMFAKKENGEPLFLRYTGSQFNEVTYLHYTGERPQVVGEILPLMYKVPENIGDMEINIVPYSISVQSERAKINLNDGKNHYLVPIITSGNDSGIVQSNGAYKSFEVKPDAVSGNTRGYLSWTVLTEIGNELIVEGVVNGKSGIYIDPNNVPEEITSLINE